MRTIQRYSTVLSMHKSTPASVIVSVSRSGHSSRLARKLEDRTGAHIVFLKTSRYQGGLLGVVRAGMDSLRNANPLPDEIAVASKSFDHLVLCGPVWLGKPAAPLRAILRSEKNSQRKVSLFLTCNAEWSCDTAIQVGAKDLERSLSSAACLPNACEGTKSEKALIDEFANTLRK